MELHRLMQIPSVGPKRMDGLNNSGINDMKDLLFYFPSKYIFRDTITKIGDVSDRQMCTTLAHVQSVAYNQSKKILSLKCIDGDADGIGETKFTIFLIGPRGMGLSYPPDTKILLWDVIRKDGKKLWFFQPPMEKIGDEEEIKDLSESFKFYPIYPRREKLRSNGISEKGLLKIIRGGLELDGKRLSDPIPKEILEKHKLPSLSDAIKSLHLPEKQEDIDLARRRFSFQAHLEKQTIFEMRRRHSASIHAPQIQPGEFTRALWEWAKFDLTIGQKKAWADIVSNLGTGGRMTRLLQGDTGSGKTHIAMLSAMAALDSGFQVVFMIPNIVLAHQHYEKYEAFFDKTGIMASLLTGSQSDRRKQHVVRNLKTGGYRLVVGTQALLSSKVGFKELGLTIIDEQHRFGVGQRMKFLSKEPTSHFLQMSATPIPRSLALSEYGDMDITTMKGFPSGRAGYRTFLRRPDARDKVYDFIESKLKNDERGFIVYPIIEESQTLDLESAKRGFESLKKRFGADKVRYLHGKMNAEDKIRIFKGFREGEFPLLCSTQVVEVGVDVPEATTMIIEDAHSFGLAQLHQLRGRVGRGELEGFCVLISRAEEGSDKYERLQRFTEMSDGFEIAELDYELRGGGKLLGTKQSGHIEYIDPDMFELTATTAKELLDMKKNNKSFLKFLVSKYGFRGHLDASL